MIKIENIKAIVLDLDGTLLSSKLQILQETKEILLKLNNSGIKIIIASGRTPQTAIPMTKELGKLSNMVLANGALIYDPNNQKILNSNPIKKETVEFFLEISKQLKKSLNIYTPSCIYMEEDKIDSYILDSGDSKKNLINQDKLDLNKEIVLKCEFFGPKEGTNTKLVDYIKVKSKELADELYITSAHINYLEILNKSVNKLYGINEVLSYYNIKDNEVLLFGDSHNDIEMLTNFANSVAMGNASDSVKKVAKYVTQSNDQNGISNFINNFTTLVG